MNPLQMFGLAAVTLMLITYAMEEGNPLWTAGFMVACIMGSAYGFMQGAWPFSLVEGVWTVVAFAKFMRRMNEMPPQTMMSKAYDQGYEQGIADTLRERTKNATFHKQYGSGATKPAGETRQEDSGEGSSTPGASE